MFSLIQNKFYPMAAPRELELIDFAFRHLYEDAILIYTQSLPLLEMLSLEYGKHFWLEMQHLDNSFERISSLCTLMQKPLLTLEDRFDPEGKYKYDGDSPVLSFGEVLQVIPNPLFQQKFFENKFSSLEIEDLPEIDCSLDDIWESVTAIYGFLLPKLQTVPLFEYQICSLLLLEIINHLEHIERHVDLSRAPLAEIIALLEPELELNDEYELEEG